MPTRNPHPKLALIPVALLFATGCTAMGGGAGDDGGDGTVTLSFANSYTTNHPHTRCGIQAVADKINEQDNGVTIETFPNSQLGGDAARFTSVVSGDVDMDVQGSSALAASYAPVGVLDMAYAFDDADHLFQFFDSPGATELKENFARETGTRILDAWYFGMRHFSANKPIREPADLQGLRMRYADSPIYLENAKAVGASATAVAFEEVYLGLQQGIIDGQENPIATIAEMSFDEVQSHVSLSGHQTGSQLIVVNENSWRKLSAEQQQALTTAVRQTRVENRTCMEDEEEKVLGEWRENNGPTVVEDVDRDAFATRAEDYFNRTLSGEQLTLYQQVREFAK
ncbi:tRNA modification GTPase [Prauserella marina]|uniref:Tripartite ATP-independent transporter solute receptor, DctP family n=1 Tax=Prauserella marina TaxID=530584 RepID=A0A222VRY2_9PSEU|nr:DctP family TRAP transporter solute-binding subunit [Prauserella marina]ASR36705.1 tRNA modification GTPase [Prauserella marina]PWV80420.1 tripartite ATP-independent transporter DctP family solute receptor [Prauserella marina]SDD53909.1 tripartite ATP-independent transporter solute receptor, DctP family [Prauserella marina]